MGFEIMCNDYLVRKKASVDLKILILEGCHTGFFQKDLPMISVKNWNFPLCLFLDKTSLGIMILVNKKLEIFCLFVFGQQRPRINVC